MQVTTPSGDVQARRRSPVPKGLKTTHAVQGDPVDFSSPTTGNQVTPLFGGPQIFPKAEELIRGAKGTVQLEMYRLGDQKMIEALADTARQGKVKVQVLLDPTPGYDAEDAKSQQKIKDYLKAAGVEILTYPTTGHGMIDHVKLLVVDGNKAIIGGMNWDKHSPNNMDADVLIEGAAVGQLENLISHDWQFSGGTPVVPPPALVGSPTTSGDAQVRVLTTTPADKEQDIGTALLNNIKNAKKSIHLMAFVLADPEIVQALKDAHAAGRDVKVILDPGKPVVYQNAKTWKELHDAGIDVRWLDVNLETQEKLHAKLGDFDGETVQIGSSNFTRNGFEVNHEADVEIKSASVGSAFDAFFNDQFEHRALKKAPDVPDFEEKAPQKPLPEQTVAALARYFKDNYRPADKTHMSPTLLKEMVAATVGGAALKKLPAADATALSKYLAAGPHATADSAATTSEQAAFIGKLAGFISQPGLIRTDPMPGDTTPLWKARLKISQDAAPKVAAAIKQNVQKMVDAVSDPEIKAFVQEAFNKAPKAFYDAASSSTGKFHPADEDDPNDLDPVVMQKRNHSDPATYKPDHPYQGGGLVLHSLRVVEVGKRLTEFLGIEGHDRDVVLGALALHDIMKYATKDAVAATPLGQDVPWTHYTTPDHGPAGALWLSKLDPTKTDLAKTLAHYVECHMATWNEPTHTPPANTKELVVSLSDYLASQTDYYVQT